MSKKKEPETLTRMWIGDVPQSLLDAADRKRKSLGYNKRVALEKMLMQFAKDETPKNG